MAAVLNGAEHRKVREEDRNRPREMKGSQKGHLERYNGSIRALQRNVEKQNGI